MVTEWRDVVGWPGYEASNCGDVWSAKSGKLLSKSLMHVGGRQYPERAYLTVRLSDGPGRRKQAYIHALVLEAFAGPRLPGQEGRHLNGNRLENFWPQNLAWGTHRENIEDAILAGATNRGWRKLDQAQADEIRRRLRAGEGRVSLAREFEVSRGCVRNIDIGKSWAESAVTRAKKSLTVAGW